MNIDDDTYLQKEEQFRLPTSRWPKIFRYSYAYLGGCTGDPSSSDYTSTGNDALSILVIIYDMWATNVCVYVTEIEAFPLIFKLTIGTDVCVPCSGPPFDKHGWRFYL